MAIPRSRPELAPPPLPPPKFIDDITEGNDPGWAWGNDPSGAFGKAKGLSMAGSNFPKSWGNSGEEKRQARQPDRSEYRRRESSTATIRSPTSAERPNDFARQQDEGYYSMSGPRPSAMTQQLHGEKNLHQRNIASSSQAYDNKLLSKIGKPKTPPRSSTFSSTDSSPTSATHPSNSRQSFQPRSLSFPNSADSAYSNGAYSDTPPIKREPMGFGDSPRSRPISPGLISSAVSAKSFMDWRSPKDQRSPLAPTDPDQDAQYPQRFPSSTNVLRQQKSRRSTSGSLLSSYDESAVKKLASARTSFKPEIYDHSEQDSADPIFPMRHLHLEDRTSQNQYSDSNTYPRLTSNPSLHTSRSRPGMKRAASQSPPAHEASTQMLPAGAIGAELYNQRNNQQRVSPGGRFVQNQSSFSSQSSTGPRNNSYASSAGLSVGGSSYTSLDQQSSGGLSPSSEQQHYHQQHNGQDSPYVNVMPMNSGPRNTRSQQQQQQQQQQQYPQPPLENYPDPSMDQKPQMDNTQRRPNGPNMQSHAFICQCCPKKPKKFDTPDELRAHESEKQYACQYCNNRFKNKNEAERHQNSLHLRKHSWSCSALNGQYDNAFYPSTSIPPADNSPPQPPPEVNTLAQFDSCGYCGEQFPNEPTPVWELRAQHLTNVHKFGECNQSKKFWRADHFRQHLKHSHAGTSGKWTNMLETSCMKDEQTPQFGDDSQNNMQPHGAPVANMGMGQANMSSPMGPPSMGHSSMPHSPLPQQSGMGQADMSQNMGQSMNQNMGQSLGQNMAQQMGGIDMSNIDPSIGMQQMGNMGAMGNMANMGTPGRGMGIQTSQMQEDFKNEMA